jgi:WD40 repeat protein
VTTDPPGATVLLDGLEVGTSPVEIKDVSCGSHVIKTSKSGYAEREKEILLEYGDELSVYLRMKEKEATFSVFSFPPGAEVFLDDKKVGITPIKLRNVAPGQHKLRVVKGEGVVHEQVVTLERGRDLALDIALPVPGAMLNIDPGPEGRELYVDGHLYTLLKSPRNSVPPGRHLLKVVGWNESELASRWLNMTKGQVYTLELKPNCSFAGRLKGHDKGILALSFVPGTSILASGAKDGTIRLWNLEQKKESLVIKAHELDPGVKSIAFSPKGDRIVSGGHDDAVRVWDAASGGRIKEFETASHVNAVAWSGDGRHVAAGCADGSMAVWAVDEGWKEKPFRGHDDAINGLAFGPDGTILISGGADGRVIVWRLSDGSQADEFKESSPVRSVSVSRDGRFLVTGCGDGEARVRSLDNPRSVKLIKVQEYWVVCLAQGWQSVFAAGGSDDKLTIFDASGGRLVELEEMGSPALALAFDGKCRILAAGSSGGVICFWHIE